MYFFKILYLLLFFQGSKEWDSLAPLHSVLSMVDNVPRHYTVYNFRDELVDLLVTWVDDVYLQLRPHLEKSSQSYQRLVIDLANGKDFMSGIDFYLAAAHIFLEEPFLIVKARKISTLDSTSMYNIEEHFLLENDRFLNPKNWKMRFTFNGINFVVPFLPTNVGNLWHEGVPILRDIQMVYEDVCSLAKCMPDTKSINAGLQNIKLHLAATAEIAHTTRFSCGSSRPQITEQPAPTMDPLMAGVTKRRVKRYEFFELTGEPVDAKRSRVFPPPTSTVVGPTPDENPDQSTQIPGTPATTSSQATPAPLVTAESEATPQSLASSLPGSQATPAPSDTTETQAAPQSVDSSSTQNVGEGSDVGSTPTADTTPVPGGYILVRQPVTDPLPTQCHCGEEFDDCAQLNIHKVSMHSSNNYECSGFWVNDDGTREECPYECSMAGTMWRHYRSQHLDIWYYYCPVPNCKWSKDRTKQYGADSEGAVKKHMVSKHNLVSDLKCIHCKYSAVSKKRLEDHMRRHSDKSKLFHCDKCGKGYRDSDGLCTHVKQAHPAIPGDMSGFFHCKYCEKMFATIASQKNHYKTAHKDITNPPAETQGQPGTGGTQ